MRAMFSPRSLFRWLLPVLLVAALSADACAGPLLQRVRDHRAARKAGGCTTVGVATGSCAGGACSLK